MAPAEERAVRNRHELDTVEKKQNNKKKEKAIANFDPLPEVDAVASFQADAELLQRLERLGNADHNATAVPRLPTDNGGCAQPLPGERVMTSYPRRLRTNQTYKVTRRGPDRPRRKAVCHLQKQGNHLHFPHVMQQFTRCVSFFIDFPQLPRKFLVRRSHQRLRESFNRGLWDILTEIFGVVVSTHLDHVVDNRTVLAHPLYDTGYDEGPLQGVAFADPSHATLLRDRTVVHYDLTSTAGGCADRRRPHKTQPVVRILNRAPQSNRTLLNVKALQTALQQFTHAPVDVVYFENRTFLEQVRFMTETDILISPHGAQLTAVNWMPAPCGTVLEAFPPGFWFPHFFGPLAATSGLRHGYVYTGADHVREWRAALRHRTVRFARRRQNVCLNLQTTMDFVADRIRQWQRCCHEHLVEEAAATGGGIPQGAGS